MHSLLMKIHDKYIKQIFWLSYCVDRIQFIVLSTLPCHPASDWKLVAFPVHPSTQHAHLTPLLWMTWSSEKGRVTVPSSLAAATENEHE
jgi:hypothetical protein